MYRKKNLKKAHLGTVQCEPREEGVGECVKAIGREVLERIQDGLHLVGIRLNLNREAQGQGEGT